MDFVKNGESSTSPLRQPTASDHSGKVVGHERRETAQSTMSRLVLPEWDGKLTCSRRGRQTDSPVYPLKPIHASQDLISLLHLDGLYQTHVLPYAEVVHETGVGDDHGGTMVGTGRKKARAKLEKGYQHLLPDCIGPRNPAVHTLTSILTVYRSSPRWRQEGQFRIASFDRRFQPTPISPARATRRASASPRRRGVQSRQARARHSRRSE